MPKGLIRTIGIKVSKTKVRTIIDMVLIEIIMVVILREIGFLKLSGVKEMGIGMFLMYHPIVVMLGLAI